MFKYAFETVLYHPLYQACVCAVCSRSHAVSNTGEYLTGHSPLKCCLVRKTLFKYAHVTNRDTVWHFHCLEGKYFMQLHIRFVKQVKGKGDPSCISSPGWRWQKQQSGKLCMHETLWTFTLCLIPSKKMLWAMEGGRRMGGKKIKKQLKEEVMDVNISNGDEITKRQSCDHSSWLVTLLLTMLIVSLPSHASPPECLLFLQWLKGC